nr:type II toxin-antitoxin system prevent-host-death family antitoxin [uncultured Thiodictyon sp.]
MRDANQHLSRYLERVEQGTEILITRHLAPTLRRGSKSRRSSVAQAFGPLERPRLHSHAERGNEKTRY